MNREAIAFKSENPRPIYAVGLFIVDIDTGNIWCVKELTSSAKTAKKAGQVSIPLETKKVNETSVGTVIGGLEEFKDLEKDESLIYITGSISSKGQYKYENGNFVDFMVLGYSKGSNISPDLQVRDKQVEGLGWMSIVELSKADNLRTGLRPFLELAIRENWIEGFRSQLLSNQIPQIILKKGDSRLDYLKRRSRIKDYRRT